jgi:hypothetical protein
MNDSNQVTRRQIHSLSTLIFLVPLLRFFVSASTESAGRAAWLCPIAALPAMLLYLYFLRQLMSGCKPGENLPELIERSFGNKLGKVALALTAIWLLVYCAFVLRAGADRLIITVYPNSSPGFFCIGLGLVCLVAALCKPRSIVRSALLVKPFVLLAMLLVIIFALIKIDWSNLLPVTVSDALPVLYGSLSGMDVLSVALYVPCFVHSLCADNEKGSRLDYLWLLRMIVLMTLLSLAILGFFGAELTERMNGPFFILVRNLVFFRTVERIEAFVVMLWLFPDFLLGSLLLYGAQYCIRRSFGWDTNYLPRSALDLSHGRFVIWLSAAAVIALSLVLGQTTTGLYYWSFKIIPLANMLFAFVFLPLVYVIGRARHSFPF